MLELRSTAIGTAGICALYAAVADQRDDDPVGMSHLDADGRRPGRSPWSTAPPGVMNPPRGGSG